MVNGQAGTLPKDYPFPINHGENRGAITQRLFEVIMCIAQRRHDRHKIQILSSLQPHREKDLQYQWSITEDVLMFLASPGVLAS